MSIALAVLVFVAELPSPPLPVRPAVEPTTVLSAAEVTAQIAAINVELHEVRTEWPPALLALTLSGAVLGLGLVFGPYLLFIGAVFASAGLGGAGATLAIGGALSAVGVAGFVMALVGGIAGDRAASEGQAKRRSLMQTRAQLERLLPTAGPSAPEALPPGVERLREARPTMLTLAAF